MTARAPALLDWIERTNMPKLPALLRASATRRPHVRDLVRTGDEANRRRSWQEAEAAYRRALEIDPTLLHIWVQLGHALKEQGQLRAAEQAYRRSLALDATLADTHLQLGHVLKLLGLIDEAADAYVTAHRCDPGLPHPRVELDAFGIGTPARPGSPLHLDRGDRARDADAEHILSVHGLRPEILRFFDSRYYFYINPAVQAALDKPELLRCLAHFCTHGVDALLPCGDGYSFDTAFYSEAYLPCKLSPANAHWHWLSVGLGNGWCPNLTKWLQGKLRAEEVMAAGLNLDGCVAFFYPGASLHSRIELYNRFIEKDVLFYGPHFPVTDDTAILFTAIADYFVNSERDDAAEIIYERVLISVPLHRQALWNYGDCLRRQGKYLHAIDVYQRAIDRDMASKWCFLHQAICYQALNELQKALACLHQGVVRFPGEPLFKSRFAEIAEQFFEQEWQFAMAIGKSGHYQAAQSRLAAACSLTASYMESKVHIPMRPLKSVAIVANLQMPQCTFYRVDHKLEHIAACDLRSTLYDFLTDLPKFVAEIRHHQAVIFYRVPGTPPIIQAINHAREMGLVTFYDIDDLIFYGDDYPGSFESFFDQITIEDYVGLKLSVPFHQTPISLCDYGLASTPALAEEMSKFVRTGRVFVYRNAFSSKQEQLAMIAPARPARDRVTIFYGSGTKSHKEDFQQLVEPALIEIVRRYKDRIEIILVGYTVLSPELESIRENLILIEPIWNLDDYWEILKQADINIAVLKPDLMTHCKSEIKWLEAAMFGIPSVVSGTMTHREVIEPGITGLICDTAEEWIKALDVLVRDRQLRERIGAAARNHVRDVYGVSRMAANLASIFAQTTPAPTPDSKPKIVIVNVFYPPQAIGGATRIVRDNVMWLVEKYREDFEIEVFTSGWGAENDYMPRTYVHDGIPVTSVSLPLSPEVEQAVADVEMQRLFGEYLDEANPALVHFHCIQRLTTSVISATSERGIPYLITAHDGWWISNEQFIVNQDDQEELYDYGDPLATARKWGGAAYSRLMQLREALLGADRVLAVSEKFAHVYRRCGVPNVVTVENGISDIKQLPRISSDGPIRLGFLGGIGFSKGYYLIKYALLSRPFKNLRLTVVDGGLESGDSRTAVWNSTPVEFVPKVSEEAVGELYAGIDVLLAPSVCIESFGLTTREALYCGCWVIASDRGSIGECIDPGQNGYVVDVSDPVALTRILMLIDDEPDRYRQPPVRDMPQRRAAEQTDELAAIYRSIVNPKEASFDAKRCSSK